jgi:hypothetical protein
MDLLKHIRFMAQATTLLSQAGVDVGVIDLLALIPEEPAPTGPGQVTG